MKNQQLITFFGKKIKRDQIGVYAAQAALYLILSVIPFLLVLTSLIRFTPVREEVLLESVRVVLPGYLSPLLVRVIGEVYDSAPGFLPAALLTAVYSAAKTIQSLRAGLHRVCDIEENRSWLALRLRAMLETFVLVLILLLLLLVLVFGKKIQAMLELYAPAAAAAAAWMIRFRMVFLFLLLSAFFALLYQMLPNRRAVFRSQFPGAVGCAAAWYVFSFGLSVYIGYFQGFSLYGSLTAVVLLMFWLYIGMYMFLIFGEVNHVFETIYLERRVRRKKAKKQR